MWGPHINLSLLPPPSLRSEAERTATAWAVGRDIGPTVAADACGDLRLRRPNPPTSPPATYVVTLSSSSDWLIPSCEPPATETAVWCWPRCEPPMTPLSIGVG